MNALLEKVAAELQPKTLKQTVYVGELSLTVRAQDLYAVLKQLKEQYGFDYLADVHSVDHFRDEARFEVGYNLFNLTDKTRLRVKTFVEEDHPEVDTAVTLWPSADWFEREVYDMMGIRFKNHPDLRRMYMPEDFEYFPLRKEFPLIGIPGSIELPEREGGK